MGSMFAVTRTAMERGDTPIAEVEGAGILFAEHVGELDLTVFAHVREEERQLVVYARRPDLVDEARRASVSELFMRANTMIAIGDLELDHDDGEMRVKVSVDVEGDELRPAMVDRMLRNAVATMEVFSPAIDRIIAGDGTPASVLADLAAAD
jgi:hypothetical protein